MITFVALASALLLVAIATAAPLWLRNRRLQEELSRLRVNDAFERIIMGRSSESTAGMTPEQRRAEFYVVRGGLASGFALLSGRLATSHWWTRNHPAIATGVATAFVALGTLLIVEISQITPHAPSASPRSTSGSSPHWQWEHHPKAVLPAGSQPSPHASRPAATGPSGGLPTRVVTAVPVEDGRSPGSTSSSPTSSSPGHATPTANSSSAAATPPDTGAPTPAGTGQTCHLTTGVLHVQLGVCRAGA